LSIPFFNLLTIKKDQQEEYKHSPTTTPFTYPGVGAQAVVVSPELLARDKVFTTGVDTLEVIDVVLPAANK
jgi:hypothetical protein